MVRLRIGVACSAVVLAGTAVACGAGAGGEEAVGPQPGPRRGEPVSVEGRVVVGDVISGDIVPVVRHGEEPPVVWTFDARTGQLQELSSPTDGWLTDPSVAATSEWVVISAASCPERPVDDDLGPVCGIDAPDALFVYDITARRWSTLEVPRRPETGIGQVVSIAGDIATISHRRSYQDRSVAFSTIELDAEQRDLRPSGEVAVGQCSEGQAPTISFSDPEYTVAHIEAVDGLDARTVELSGEAVPLVSGAGSPGPSCISARDLMLLPGTPTESRPGFRYSVYRLDGSPTEVAAGEGVLPSLVAGPDWFAVTDERATVVRDREGNVLREIPRVQPDEPVAAASGLVLVGYDRDARTTLRVEAVR